MERYHARLSSYLSTEQKMKLQVSDEIYYIPGKMLALYKAQKWNSIVGD